ncbi:hypothetical protein ACRW9N_13520, partial [Listeria aquatica]|uniref:hypothetical protein n=1 Tax=Listeria aquatica TaxID=1494960 RepID=UPI003EF43CBC
IAVYVDFQALNLARLPIPPRPLYYNKNYYSIKWTDLSTFIRTVHVFFLAHMLIFTYSIY